MRKLFRSVIFVFMIGIIVGMVLHNNRHYFRGNKNMKVVLPHKNELVAYKKNILTVRYSSGIRLYVDRDYHDLIRDKRIDGLFAVLIPRHFQSAIGIQTKEDLTVYRLVDESSEKSIFSEYDSTDIKVNVLTGGSPLTRVVRKKFPAGKVQIISGGLESSYPILISSTGDSFSDSKFHVLTVDNSMDKIH
jgi:hypothetical protein